MDAERDRQVGLAGAGRAQEDDVLCFGEEVELREVRHGLVLHRPLEREVEVVEGLDLREPGCLHPVLTAVGFAGGDLFGEHCSEVGLVVPALVGGTLRERAGPFRDPRGFERSGEERDL